MKAELRSHSIYKLLSAVLLTSLLVAGLSLSTPPVARALATYAYDFGTASSPVAAGYTMVTEATAYSSGSFGWTDNSTLESRDRGLPADLTRDFVTSGSAARTFQVDLPNGAYAVTVTMGDNDNPHDNMVVTANSNPALPDVDNAAGAFTVNTFNVTVSGGSLSLQFSDGGGTDTSWVLNGVSIVLIPPPAPSTKYDFGTASSPVAAGYTMVTEATAYAPGGFGWTDNSTLESRDRGLPADLTRDFVMSSSAARTFQTDIPNGTYAVTVTMGDNGYPHDNMVVTANGSPALPDVDNAAGAFTVNTFNVVVAGGTLSLQFSDGGGTDGTWVVNAVSISVVVPTGSKFDFGTASSPLAAGYMRVTEATAYAPGGFGWTDNSTLESRDRAAPADDLKRDFVLSSSAARIFKTDLPNGLYGVTVTMGDSGYAHDHMVVAANGTTVLSNVTTAAGAFAVNAFPVTVSVGSLSLQFSDGGGTDTTWVVNAVSITPAHMVHVNIGGVGAQDGWVLESAPNSGVGGSMSATGTSLFVGDNTQNRQYRGILSFATSSLPDRAVVTNVTLKLTSPGKAGSPWTLGNILVDMKGSVFGTKALQLTDFQAAADLDSVATITKTLTANLYTVSLPGAAFPLINKVGTTQLRLRFESANNNNLANDYLLVYSGEKTPTSSRPTLMIDYFVP